MTNVPAAESGVAISPSEVGAIATEVQQLIKEGDHYTAWERLSFLHPADMGAILLAMPRHSRDALLQVMSPDTVAWMLHQMNPLQASRVAARLGSRMISGVLDQVHPRVALNALMRLRPNQAREVAESLEQSIPDADIFAHPAGTAGALMARTYPVANINGTVSDAQDGLRDQAESPYEFNRVYLVDARGQLEGQVTVVNLALHPQQTPLRTISEPVVATVDANTPASECARLRRHYGIVQLPVVSDGELRGVIPLEFLLSAVVEEDTRQMLNVGGVAGDSREHTLVSAIKTRLPWLTVNLGTTFLAAAAISLFESTLAQVVILAAFLPVVAGQGGIGGTQTLTMIVRSLALGEFIGVSAFRLLAREALLGLLHGVWFGLLVGVIGFLWTRNPGLGMVLALAMVGNMVIAGVAGASVPLFLRRIGVDPAVASAVVVTTFTDVFGFLLFLGIATAMLSLLT